MNKRKASSILPNRCLATFAAGGILLVAACSSTSREFTEASPDGGGSGGADVKTTGGSDSGTGGSQSSDNNGAGANGQAPDAACSKGERRCENSSTALVCNSEQSGFERDECGTATCIAGRCEKGLIAYFQFDEGTGTNTKDAVGGVPGKLEGAEWVDGRIGNAVRFDNAGERINFGDVFNESIRYPLTLAIWVYMDGLGWGSESGMGTLFVSENRNDYCGIQWAVRPTTVDLIAGKCGGSDNGLNRRDFAASFKNAIEGEWLHLVSIATAHDRDFVHYLNGQFLDSGIDPNGSYTGEIIAKDADAVAGSSIWGGSRKRELNGRIDELKIYGRELSAIEVEALYESY